MVVCAQYGHVQCPQPTKSEMGYKRLAFVAFERSENTDMRGMNYVALLVLAVLPTRDCPLDHKRANPTSQFLQFAEQEHGI